MTTIRDGEVVEQTFLDGGTGETTQSGMIRVNAADFGNGREGVLATLRTPAGSPTNDTNDNTRVTVGGVETTVGNAVRLGYLIREGERVFEPAKTPSAPQGETPPNAPQSTTATPQGPTIPQPDVLSAEASAAQERLNTALPPITAQHVAARLIAGKSIDMGLLNASVADSAQALADIETLREGYSHQAGAYLIRNGVAASDLDHFREWAAAVHPREFQMAMSQHFHSGDPAHYADLARKFARTVAPHPDNARAAGIEVRRDIRGNDLVTIKGMTMTLKAAARAGLM